MQLILDEAKIILAILRKPDVWRELDDVESNAVYRLMDMISEAEALEVLTASEIGMGFNSCTRRKI